MNKLKINLRECRLNEGKKQRDIADYLKITQSTYSKWEQGISEPSSHQLIKLADFYNVTTDFLLGRQNYETGVIEIKNELAPIENNIINMYRKLDERRQHLAYTYIRGLAAN